MSAMDDKDAMPGTPSRAWLDSLIARGCANPHSRAKFDLTEGVELGNPNKSAPRRANVRGHGIGTEVQMHAERTVRNAYYLTGFVRIEAASEEEAVRKFEDAGLGIDVSIADGVTLDFQGPWDEVSGVIEDDCICPPDLLARGGHKGGCPVHA